MLSGIVSVLILIADVWAIINIFQSSESTGSKALWIVLVLVLPLLGLIIWWFAGPKSASG
ncbi:MAG: PLDc N-terminal domain-containing protein [Myxococcota bacterium]